MPAITHTEARERLTGFTKLMALASKLYHANPNNSPKPMDITNEDVQRLLQSLHRHDVKYLLVGGMAGVFHGYIRTTQDMDLWVKSDEENKIRLISALQENEVAGATYLKNVPLIFGWTSVTVGRQGFTLDMGFELKAFRDADFDACYNRAVDAVLDSVPFKVIHLNDLLREKRSTGRAKDLADAEELEKIIKKQSTNDPD